MVSINSLIKSTIRCLPEKPLGEANLTLTFEVGDGTFTENVFGQEVEGTKKVVIQVAAREGDRNELSGSQIGSGFYEVYLEGRLVKPKFLPPSINLEDVAQAVLKDPASKTELKGEFRLTPSVQNRFPELTLKMGQLITGILNTVGAT
jgi:hypothetical protein